MPSRACIPLTVVAVAGACSAASATVGEVYVDPNPFTPSSDPNSAPHLGSFQAVAPKYFFMRSVTGSGNIMVPQIQRTSFTPDIQGDYKIQVTVVDNCPRA